MVFLKYVNKKRLNKNRYRRVFIRKLSKFRRGEWRMYRKLKSWVIRKFTKRKFFDMIFNIRRLGKLKNTKAVLAYIRRVKRKFKRRSLPWTYDDILSKKFGKALSKSKYKANLINYKVNYFRKKPKILKHKYNRLNLSFLRRLSIDGNNFVWNIKGSQKFKSRFKFKFLRNLDFRLRYLEMKRLKFIYMLKLLYPSFYRWYRSIMINFALKLNLLRSLSIFEIFSLYLNYSKFSFKGVNKERFLKYDRLLREMIRKESGNVFASSSSIIKVLKFRMSKSKDNLMNDLLNFYLWKIQNINAFEVFRLIFFYHLNYFKRAGKDYVLKFFRKKKNKAKKYVIKIFDKATDPKALKKQRKNSNKSFDINYRRLFKVRVRYHSFRKYGELMSERQLSKAEMYTNYHRDRVIYTRKRNLKLASLFYKYRDLDKKDFYRLSKKVKFRLKWARRLMKQRKLELPHANFSKKEIAYWKRSKASNSSMVKVPKIRYLFKLKFLNILGKLSEEEFSYRFKSKWFEVYENKVKRIFRMRFKNRFLRRLIKKYLRKAKGNVRVKFKKMFLGILFRRKQARRKMKKLRKKLASFLHSKKRPDFMSLKEYSLSYEHKSSRFLSKVIFKNRKVINSSEKWFTDLGVNLDNRLFLSSKGLKRRRILNYNGIKTWRI